MEDKVKTLLTKLKQPNISTDIEQVKSLYSNDFWSIYEDKEIFPISNHESWESRIHPIFAVINIELANDNIEDALICMISNLESVINKKSGLPTYYSLVNLNKEVDQKEKIVRLKTLAGNIEKSMISRPDFLQKEASDASNILKTLTPITFQDKYKSNCKYIEIGIRDVYDGSKKWREAKRPSASLSADFNSVRNDISNDIRECISILEMKE